MRPDSIVDDHEDDSSASFSDQDEDRLTLQDGLSAEALQALLEFQSLGGRPGADWYDNDTGVQPAEGAADEGDDDPSSAATAPAAAPLCVAYTANDSKVIAETVRRLQERAEEKQRRGREGAASTAASSSAGPDNGPVRLDHTTIPDLVAPTRPSSVSDGSSVVEDATVTTADALVDPVEDYAQALQAVLERDGAVRINGVLEADLCDQCRIAIDNALAASERKEASSTSSKGTANADVTAPSQTEANNNGTIGGVDGFGNVFSRHNRYDMYLRPNDDNASDPYVYGRALRQLLYRQSSTSSSSLGQLLHNCATSNAQFHEFSCLVADPGCGHQPLHPDAPYSVLPPMWTIFVALQDVTPDMGPTIVVPTSHLIDILWNDDEDGPKDGASRLDVTNPMSYRRATLSKGDCLVMDARTWHFGSANTTSDGETKRRTLLYVTLRNPNHSSRDDDYPPNGSLYPDLKHLRLRDFSGIRE